MATAARRTLSATTLIGDKVYNPAQEELGYIKELMLDLETGHVAYAVLSFGGLFGFGDKLFAIPWAALELHAEDHCFILDTPREQLEVAEGFDQNDWPDFADRDWGARIHAFYGVRPYWD